MVFVASVARTNGFHATRTKSRACALNAKAPIGMLHGRKRMKKLLENLDAKRNLFCQLSDLNNEADVEAWFIHPLLQSLGFVASEIRLKEQIKSYSVGMGSRTEKYTPDFILEKLGQPVVVIDAKNPDQDVYDWVPQCTSYCIEVNRAFESNPAQFFVVSNGKQTVLYRWDQSKPLVILDFLDFQKGNKKWQSFQNFISKEALHAQPPEKEGAGFEFHTVTLDELNKVFQKLHTYIRSEEKKSPSGVFLELVKIIFVKLQKDRELRLRVKGRAIRKSDVGVHPLK